MAELAAEVARVLRRGGDVEFHCSSCDARRLVDALVAAFEGAGLERLETPKPGYPLILRKV